MHVNIKVPVAATLKPFLASSSVGMCLGPWSLCSKMGVDAAVLCVRSRAAYNSPWYKSLRLHRAVVSGSLPKLPSVPK